MSFQTLSGKPLVLPPLSAETQATAEANLEEARTNFEHSRSLENSIWLGRRYAYLNRFEEAFAIYDDGIERFPNAYELYRHRGHRYISTRQLNHAIADFERAAELAEDKPVELEADGIPNSRNQPTSTGHFNIWYHLGLAYYLSGEMQHAAAAYRRCLRDYSDEDDSLCATSDWLYMTYRRLGDIDSAEKLLTPIHAGMTPYESDSYLRRLLMYKGELSAESLLKVEGDSAETNPLQAQSLVLATQGYGVGNWYLYNGDKESARAVFEQVLATDSVTAFGYIAAEADMLTL